MQNDDSQKNSSCYDTGETAREQLANQEGQLINALLGLAPAPSEVDSKQVEVCGLSLKRKRARTLSRLLNNQDTTCSIKLEFEEYFVEFPGPHPDGPCADFRRYQQFTNRGIIHKIVKWVEQSLMRYLG